APIFSPRNVVGDRGAPSARSGPRGWSVGTKRGAPPSDPPRATTEPQAARNANFPLPDVLGLGVMIQTLGLRRSGQSLMPLGLPLRTTNTIVDVYGTEWLGRLDSHPAGIKPDFAIALVSGQSASVTTSASRPSMTARAWVEEPPCDCLTVTPAPAGVFAKASFRARQTSRVGS